MKTLTFRPTPKQASAWERLSDKTTTEIGFGGGANCAKSWLGCSWLAISCIAYPGTGWLMAREELVNLKRTTLITFHKVCESFGLVPNVHYFHNQQTNIIRFTNGSEIFLMDLAFAPSDPLYTRLGSLELTGAFIDESAEVKFVAIDIVRTRIGRRKNAEYGLAPKLLETFNPDKGHVHSRYYRPWKDSEMPDHRAFIKATVRDNPHATEDYIRQLERSDTITRERLLNGNFDYDDDPTALIGYDALSDLFTNHVEGGLPFLVIDPAYLGQDLTVMRWGNGNRFTGREAVRGVTTDVTVSRAKELCNEHKIPRSRVVVDRVGIGAGVADGLQGCYPFVANATPVGADTNFSNLKSQCSWLLADKINARELYVDANGDTAARLKLIEELEQIKALDPDKDRKQRVVPKDEVKLRLGRSPDDADCLVMRMALDLKEARSAKFAPKVHPYGRR